MKKRIISISIFFIIIISFGVSFAFFWPKVKMETIKNGKQTLEEMFAKEGNFYVFFYRDDCRYCANVETEIEDFANTVELYRADSGFYNTNKYDWAEHEMKYDVEIGEIDENGKIVFYHDLNEKNIMDMYPPVHYNIVLATEGYVALHNEKEEGKVYAICTHPILNENDLQSDNFVLPGIPMLVEFDDNRIVNYYFDDKEILHFLNSETEPIGKYWNLD